MFHTDSLNASLVDSQILDNGASSIAPTLVLDDNVTPLHEYNICRTGGESLVGRSSTLHQSVFCQDMFTPFNSLNSYGVLLNSMIGSCCTVFGHKLLSQDLGCMSDIESSFTNCLYINIMDVLSSFGEKFSDILISRGHSDTSTKNLIHGMVSYIRDNMNDIVDEIESRCFTFFCSKFGKELKEILVKSCLFDGSTIRVLLPDELSVLESCFNAVISSNKRMLIDAAIDRYTFYLKVILLPDDVVTCEEYRENIISYCAAAAFASRFILNFSNNVSLSDNNIHFTSRLGLCSDSYYNYNREKLMIFSPNMTRDDNCLLHDLKDDFLSAIDYLVMRRIDGISLSTQTRLDACGIYSCLVDVELNSYLLKSEVWEEAVNIFDRNFSSKLSNLGLVSNSDNSDKLDLSEDIEFIYAFISDLFYNVDVIVNRNIKDFIDNILKNCSGATDSVKYLDNVPINSGDFSCMYGYCIDKLTAGIISHIKDVFFMESKYCISYSFDKLVSSCLSDNVGDEKSLPLYYCSYKAFSIARRKCAEVFCEKFIPSMKSLSDSVFILDSGKVRKAYLQEIVDIIRCCVFDIDNSQLKAMDYSWKSTIGLLAGD
ncbi:hypothetical protein [Candidatus Ichthyocystis sparus]|uniref:hypothetical protein n=2 Tax=Candidatus Ichthyocystis sparus TaxID=1561004 RepID=UPI000B883D5A|nr:hypothetical protein [Candidatus Ichthyocystis sparus]